jgi:hypothetical protein
MEVCSAPHPPGASLADLHDVIAQRAREIYETSGRIPGRDVENWCQAEAEILRERAERPPKRAIKVRVNGVEFVGEYHPELSGGYAPGEFLGGNLVPVRFAGDKMFVKRPNGKELETTIVKRVGSG